MHQISPLLSLDQQKRKLTDIYTQQIVTLEEDLLLNLDSNRKITASPSASIFTTHKAIYFALRDIILHLDNLWKTRISSDEDFPLSLRTQKMLTDTLYGVESRWNNAPMFHEFSILDHNKKVAESFARLKLRVTRLGMGKEWETIQTLRWAIWCDVAVLWLLLHDIGKYDRKLKVNDNDNDNGESSDIVACHTDHESIWAAYLQWDMSYFQGDKVRQNIATATSDTLQTYINSLCTDNHDEDGFSVKEAQWLVAAIAQHHFALWDLRKKLGQHYTPDIATSQEANTIIAQYVQNRYKQEQSKAERESSQLYNLDIYHTLIAKLLLYVVDNLSKIQFRLNKQPSSEEYSKIRIYKEQILKNVNNGMRSDDASAFLHNIFSSKDKEFFLIALYELYDKKTWFYLAQSLISQGYFSLKNEHKAFISEEHWHFYCQSIYGMRTVLPFAKVIYANIALCCDVSSTSQNFVVV